MFSMLFLLSAGLLLCSQCVLGYVIVNTDRGDLYESNPHEGAELEEVYTGRDPMLRQANMLENAYIQKLPELYYMIQVVRSYRPPAAHPQRTPIRGSLYEQLTRNELRDELTGLLDGIDGFEEIFNVGQYAQPDPLKEHLANDVRLLLPLLVGTLSDLRRPDAMNAGKIGQVVQAHLREASNGFRALLTGLAQFESVALEEIEQPSSIETTQRDEKDEETTPIEGLETIVYVTEMPVASEKEVVNDYDLEDAEQINHNPSYSDEKPKAGNALRLLVTMAKDTMYKINPIEEQFSIGGVDLDDEEDRPSVIVLTKARNEDALAPTTGEDPVSEIVSMEDPEMVALVPFIIEQQRLGVVSPEEEETLASIFGSLWPQMVLEAKRARTEPFQ